MPVRALLRRTAQLSHPPRAAARRAINTPSSWSPRARAVTYHYELDARWRARRAGPACRPYPEPSFDDYGRALADRWRGLSTPASVTATPRSAPTQLALIHAVQNESPPHLHRHALHGRARRPELDTHRLAVACEVRTYELTGVEPPAGEQYLSLGARCADPADRNHWTTTSSRPDGTPHARLIEHAATLYFKDDLSGPLDLGKLARLGLTYEAYKLAMTGPLIDGSSACTAPRRLARRSARPRRLPTRPAATRRSGRPGHLPLAALRRGGLRARRRAPLLPARALSSTLRQRDDARLSTPTICSCSPARCARQRHVVEAFDHRVLAPARLTGRQRQRQRGRVRHPRAAGGDGADGQAHQRRARDRRHGRRAQRR